jgi:hypothetical protein
MEYCACMRNACATSTIILFRFRAFFGTKLPERFWLLFSLKVSDAPIILLVGIGGT